MAGAIAKQIIPQVKISAYVSAVGPHKFKGKVDQKALELVEQNILRAPDLTWAKEMEDFIKSVRKDGDTVGGVISCQVTGVPIGWGSPIFDKLHANLGKAMLTINAVKGFEYGSGFAGAQMRGSAHNDLFTEGGRTKTNYSGGIQGGISNGEPIMFRVAFKPVATLMQAQEVLDQKGQIKKQSGKGRHDPCVVPRAVPIVEALCALVLADAYLDYSFFANSSINFLISFHFILSLSQIVCVIGNTFLYVSNIISIPFVRIFKLGKCGIKSFPNINEIRI